MSDNLADAIARLNQTGALDHLATIVGSILAAEIAKTQPGRRERIATAALERVRWTPRMHAVAGNAATERLLLELSARRRA